MQNNKKIEIVLAVILIILSFFTLKSKNQETVTSSLKLPEKITTIRGEDIALLKDEKDFVNETGARIEKKKYGPYIITLISGNSAKEVHSPATCYEANGYKMVSEEIVDLTPDLEAVKSTFTGKNRETVYYWFFNKNSKTTSFSEVFISSAKGETGWSLISIATTKEEVPEEILIEVDKYFTE